MRRTRIGLSVIVVVFGAALFAAEASAVDDPGRPLTVRILETEDPEGNFDVGSPADFYATIKIGSSAAVETSHQDFPPEFGTGFTFPWADTPTGWEATEWVDVSAGSVSVQIQVRDEDTDVPFDDPDVVDVKPGNGETLAFAVDPVSGAISGDVTATMGTSFDVSGTGDDRARIRVLVAFDDSDGDGLVDSWETSGHDGLNLASMGADPQRKDLFLEIDCLAADANNDNDYTDSVDHNHCPTQQAVRTVVQAFANAPVPNPDGTSGIQLHVDVGSRFGSGAVILVVGTGGVVGTFGDYGGGGQLLDEAGNTVMSLKPSSSNPNIWDVKTMSSSRVDVFRYGLFAHQVDRQGIGRRLHERRGRAARKRLLRLARRPAGPEQHTLLDLGRKRALGRQRQRASRNADARVRPYPWPRPRWRGRHQRQAELFLSDELPQLARPRRYGIGEGPVLRRPDQYRGNGGATRRL